MGHVALLALTASFNPTLLAATTMMLLLDRPAGLMAGYLAGAAWNWSRSCSCSRA